MENITKLNIFDFDGTLARTPMPEFGKPEFERKTGVVWQHKGWWSKPESLDMSVFEIPMIKETYDACVKGYDLPEVYTVMVTGRMLKLAPHVEKILNTNALEFDEYHYNSGGDTFTAKIKIFNELISKLPNLEVVEIWEDRKPHVEGFIEWGDTMIENDKFKKHIINIVE